MKRTSGKSRRTNHKNELDYLRDKVKTLESQIKSLKRHLQSNKKHLNRLDTLEELVKEQEVEVESDNPDNCQECGKGVLKLSSLGVRMLLSCSNCKFWRLK